jgi:hypothetical protein
MIPRGQARGIAFKRFIFYTGDSARKFHLADSSSNSYVWSKLQSRLAYCLRAISAQTPCVCRERKPAPTFPDHALRDRLDFSIIAAGANGVADPLAEQRSRERRDVRDRALRRISFVLADDPERLSPSVFARDRNVASELHHVSAGCGSSQLRLARRALQ